MKILRVRRGFTTNSSSYTEWLPPPSGQGQTGTSAAPGNVAATARPATPAASQANVQGPPATTTVQAGGGHLAGNTVTVLGLLAALGAVFFTEKLLRRFRRKHREQEEDEDR